MKAPEVHKVMRRHFMPFLFEHGLSKAGRVSMAASSAEGTSLWLGYKLGVGWYDWTGNSIDFYGSARCGDRALQFLTYTPCPRESLMPRALREQLRAMAINRLHEICMRGQAHDASSPNFLILNKFFQQDLARAESDPFFAPEFRFLNEDDLIRWCRVVTPHIAESIDVLRRAARNAGDRPTGFGQ